MKSWRDILWPGIAASIALVILLALGTWQVARHKEKTNILNALNNAANATPKALTAAEFASLTVHSNSSKTAPKTSMPELTRVVVTGKFLVNRSVPVRATLPTPKNQRSLGGLGFFWMTPLQVDNGPLIFINRGFVPVGADYKAPAIETPEDQQTITGILRQAEKPQLFTPADNPAKGEYFIREPKLLAGYVSVKDPVGYFIDAERSNIENLIPPVGIEAQEMISRIPNNHLSYAVTWYGLALTLLGVFAVFAYGQIKTAKNSTRENQNV